MPFEAFLKVDGVKGECVRKGKEDQIEVEQFGFHVAQPAGGVGRGGGQAGGRAEFSDLSIVKELDLTSPDLYAACANAKVFPKVELTCRAAAGEDPIDYFKVTLENAMITSIGPSGAVDGGSKPTEAVAFSFAKVTWAYTHIGPDNRKLGDVAKDFDLHHR